MIGQCNSKEICRYVIVKDTINVKVHQVPNACQKTPDKNEMKMQQIHMTYFLIMRVSQHDTV